MYCKNCGSEIRKNSKYCSKFGTKVLGEDISEKKKEKENDSSFCKNCGCKIESKNVYCPNCGYNLINNTSNVNKNLVDDPVESFVIYVISFIIPLVGFILWVITRKENPKRAKNILIVSFVSIISAILLVVLVLLFVSVYFFNSYGGVL